MLEGGCGGGPWQAGAAVERRPEWQVQTSWPSPALASACVRLPKTWPRELGKAHVTFPSQAHRELDR